MGDKSHRALCVSVGTSALTLNGRWDATGALSREVTS